MKSGIYVIENTVTGGFYIGSSCNMRHRWACHRWDLRHNVHGNERLQRAWNKYGEGAFAWRPICLIARDDLAAVETRLLARLALLSHCYNIALVAGAPTAGRKMPPEYGRAISERLRGRRFTPEHRAKIGAAHRGKTISPEVRERLSAMRRGKKQPPGWSAKMHAAQREKKLRNGGVAKRRPGIRPPCSPETRAKIAAKALGRKHTAETREKIGAASRGKPSPKKGTKMSEESRAKMRASRLRYLELMRHAEHTL